MLNDIKLRNLPSYGKLFVGMTTTLMLGVVLWSIFIFYVDKGLIDEGTVPLYMQQQVDELTHEDDPVLYHEALGEEAEVILDDSLAELAPDWDSDFVEETVPIDSAEMVKKFEERDDELSGTEEAIVPDDDAFEDDDTIEYYDWKEHLRDNVGLAHTHQNGQTLLYFVMGLLLLFTSIKNKQKKILLWVFGIIIFTHTIGLSGEGFHWFFDDLLAISGVGLLLVIPFICFVIFAELLKEPEKH